MTLTWKTYRGTESVFWEAYKKEGDQTVITKLSDENGWLRTDVTVTHQGYEYKGKNVPKKDGKGYWHFVERRSALGEQSPEQVAHESTIKEYADRQKHIDELAERKLAILERIAVATERKAQTAENINETLANILKALYKQGGE